MIIKLTVIFSKIQIILELSLELNVGRSDAKYQNLKTFFEKNENHKGFVDIFNPFSLKNLESHIAQ